MEEFIPSHSAGCYHFPCVYIALLHGINSPVVLVSFLPLPEAGSASLPHVIFEVLSVIL